MTARKDVRDRAIAAVKDLPDRMRRMFDRTPGRDARPLEIRAALLDDLEPRIVAVGGGKKILPYNRVTVRLVAPADQRAALDAAFTDYAARIGERLRELRCDPPADLQVRIQHLKKPPADWPAGRTYDAEYGRHAPADAAQPVLHLRVTTGKATRDKYAFTEPIVRVGRAAELRDRLGNVRHNDVVFFDDEDAANKTVGRAHCHFKYDRVRSDYRLFDDGSSNGTFIVRGGDTLRVPPRDPRGVRVQSGDEIKLGTACLKLVVGE